MNDNANVNVSDKKDKEIEDLKKQLSAANASWTKYFKECETLKQELLGTIKVQRAGKSTECHY